ncbi:efflux RND transporter periplasmic adaptor subunit [Falsigemmobacter faecalis]|uniref:Efflux RND transporter periplasmic adaptor subunit n=1 Tax=Falsigemmobacter faecalis TaxID=2488730 RepID=A0A3P3DKR6_9RHOB|nr:efflux RND transporter periplasmic adaptor subunit [Falsigemmobacter faecalis]RRH74326.1 efflux RND transporter periplasmic adaptor subunit [Falsigemmobacter faecalis]
MHFPASLLVSALLLFPSFTAPGLAQVPPQVPPKQVGVVTLNPGPIPQRVTLPGRAVAFEEAAIRPRVSGLVTGISYRAGRPLKAGDEMFRVDPGVYESRVTSADAEVRSAKAAAGQAAASLARAEQLVGSGVSRADLENTRSAGEQADARVSAAQAQLAIAKAELEWTVIRAPIDGVASVASVSVGDLVTASQAQELATITRLDPIEVDILSPSAAMQRVVADIRAGRMTVNEKISATLTLETGETYEVAGELEAAGFRVSQTTGAIDYRFLFANPDLKLLPGQFVRGEISFGTREGYLVSQSAASRARTGLLNVFLVENGKAVQHQLSDLGSFEHHWIVTEGLTPGAQLIVDGLSGLTPGAEVVSVEVELTEGGVPKALAPPAPPAAPAKE